MVPGSQVNPAGQVQLPSRNHERDQIPCEEVTECEDQHTPERFVHEKPLEPQMEGRI